MQLILLLHLLTAPAAETSNDLSSWVGEELNVSDRPELTSAKVVVSGGTSLVVFYNYSGGGVAYDVILMHMMAQLEIHFQTLKLRKIMTDMGTYHFINGTLFQAGD